MRLKFPILALVAISAAAANAEVVDFHSGNGGGSTDTNITFMQGGVNTSFNTLTSSDFAAADSGASAFILGGLANGWISNLPTDSSAKWIGVDQTGWNNSYNSHSGLYSMAFNLNNSASSATLNITFSVDDQFGDANNQGLFIDGVAIPNSTSQTDWNNQVETKSYSLGALSAGQHHLYMDVYNSGSGPSGVIFSGNITAESVPEPASMGALAIGAIGLVRRRRARRA